MPVRVDVPIRVFDQDGFHQVDHRVTGLAFDIHNEFGRYLEEKLYLRELIRRCRGAGLSVEPEVCITAYLEDFRKDYVVELLVNSGVFVEAKAVAALSPGHIGQMLNYLFMCGLHHATLLNFRTERVQRQFVSTRMTHADRQIYDVDVSSWTPLSPRCRQLHEVFLRTLVEWGAFLDPDLYREACTHFLGGQTRIVRDVPVHSEGESIGTQKMHLLADDVAFSVTASTHRPESVCEHQRRFLQHTPLRAIQWINLNHHNIHMRTITKS